MFFCCLFVACGCLKNKRSLFDYVALNKAISKYVSNCKILKSKVRSRDNICMTESKKKGSYLVESKELNLNAWYGLFTLLLNSKSKNNYEHKVEKSGVRRVQKNTPGAL